MEEVERRRRQDDLNFFMRLRVALPITKPIRRGVYIADLDGERNWVRFKLASSHSVCDEAFFLTKKKVFLF